MSESNSTASKRLKFRLEVTIDDAGRVIAADLRVRDGATRESKSLGGWPVPAEGTDVGRLIEAIYRLPRPRSSFFRRRPPGVVRNDGIQRGGKRRLL